MPLDLTGLLYKARTERRIPTHRAAIDARIAQKALTSALAEEHARHLAKRQLLSRALAASDLDALRFRWLAEHPQQMAELANGYLIGKPPTLDQIRRTIDDWQNDEAIKHLCKIRSQIRK